MSGTPHPFFDAAPITFTYTATGKCVSMTDPTGTPAYTYTCSQ